MLTQIYVATWRPNLHFIIIIIIFFCFASVSLKNISAFNKQIEISWIQNMVKNWIMCEFPRLSLEVSLKKKYTSHMFAHIIPSYVHVHIFTPLITTFTYNFALIPGLHCGPLADFSHSASTYAVSWPAVTSCVAVLTLTVSASGATSCTRTTINR